MTVWGNSRGDKDKHVAHSPSSFSNVHSPPHLRGPQFGLRHKSVLLGALFSAPRGKAMCSNLSWWEERGSLQGRPSEKATAFLMKRGSFRHTACLLLVFLPFPSSRSTAAQMDKKFWQPYHKSTLPLWSKLWEVCINPQLSNFVTQKFSNIKMKKKRNFNCKSRMIYALLH